VYAIGNQELAEEASIPGVVDIVGRHDDDWDEWLGEKLPSGRYEQFPKRRERLSLIADLHPEADDFIVVDDLDLSDVAGWEHYQAWEFVPAVEQGLIDPNLPWVHDISTDGGMPTTAGIMPADPMDLASFLDEYAGASGYELEYTDGDTERSVLCHSIAIGDDPRVDSTLQCTPIDPAAAKFSVEFKNIQLLSVVEPPPEAFISDFDSLAEKATALRRLSNVHPGAIDVSSLLGILDRADGPPSRDEDALKALRRVAAARPEDCTPAIPILQTVLSLDATPGEVDILLTLAQIGATDASAIAPVSDDITPYLDVEEPLPRKAAARCMAIIAEEHPEDVVNAVPQLASIIETESNAEEVEQAVYGFSGVTREFPEAVQPHAETLQTVVLDDNTPDTVRLNATAALGRIVSENPTVGVGMVEELVELFDAKNPKLRNNAIGLIADVAKLHTDVVEPHTDDITPLLDAEDTFTRINASNVVSRIAEDFPTAVDSITPTLVKLVDDEDERVRKNVCEALGHIGAVDATENLEETARNDSDAAVRKHASLALTEIQTDGAQSEQSTSDDQDMVEYPPDELQEVCAICGEQFEQYGSEFASNYANLVCEFCDEQAVTNDGTPPKHGNEYLGQDSVVEKSDGRKVIRMAPDVGDNPVFIDGEKCWRRYRFGGWITCRDELDCDSIQEFYDTHWEDL
jgi:HEAT repeat protein